MSGPKAYHCLRWSGNLHVCCYAENTSTTAEPVLSRLTFSKGADEWYLPTGRLLKSHYQEFRIRGLSLGYRTDAPVCSGRPCCRSLWAFTQLSNRFQELGQSLVSQPGLGNFQAGSTLHGVSIGRTEGSMVSMAFCDSKAFRLYHHTNKCSVRKRTCSSCRPLLDSGGFDCSWWTYDSLMVSGGSARLASLDLEPSAENFSGLLLRTRKSLWLCAQQI